MASERLKSDTVYIAVQPIVQRTHNLEPYGEQLLDLPHWLENTKYFWPEKHLSRVCQLYATHTTDKGAFI